METLPPFFFELFGDLPKQGPGSTASSLRALGAIPDVGELQRILDAGCGSGRSTLLLAERTPATITALDLLDEQIAALEKNVSASAYADRIEIVQGSMGDLSFAKEPFDLIWAESSIYNIGFEKGLRYWKEHLKDGGYIGVSEAVWLTDKPDAEVKAFWDRMYPAIQTVPNNMALIAHCGYELLDHFLQPKSDWWEGFYDILSERVAAYRKRELNDEAKAILAQTEIEIDIFRKYADQYGYAFFVMRKVS